MKLEEFVPFENEPSDSSLAASLQKCDFAWVSYAFSFQFFSMFMYSGLVLKHNEILYPNDSN